MTPITKIFDDSFKKDILTLIRKGVTDMRKAIPPGAVYSASKKPPEGARIGTTAGGAQYWIPSKKDKEDKPKASSTPKTGKEQFTNKQRKKLADEWYDSYQNLGTEAKELYFGSDNDPDIYRQRTTPIIDNLKKKMKKGIYERAKAEKLAKYLMDDVSKKIESKSRFGSSFSPFSSSNNQRREAAAHWVKNFESEYAAGQYD